MDVRQKLRECKIELEERILEILQEWEDDGDDYDLNTQLYRNDHISFCYSGLQRLPGFLCFTRCKSALDSILDRTFA
eukprot:TRINITY_DN5718_c0_g1_i1.p1 TRINITY_DN5718_c0_g1~~TRINITY_DN5718_c0_g1_i1.p1  ORF type:complete len:77 (-),score=10.83 TRINITY_DN5718_c0_g1_i1:147-377(-)